jgi:hypothetical protein
MLVEESKLSILIDSSLKSIFSPFIKCFCEYLGIAVFDFSSE